MAVGSVAPQPPSYYYLQRKILILYYIIKVLRDDNSIKNAASPCGTTPLITVSTAGPLPANQSQPSSYKQHLPTPSLSLRITVM